MSSRSDRYARWFGTRVPSSSRAFVFILTAGIAFAFSFPLLQIWIIQGPYVFSIIVPAIGLGIHLGLVAMQQLWLKTDNTNEELNNLISEIFQKTVIPSRTRVWIRKSDIPFITSVYTVLFEAVIISEPMVDLILASPESGRALLAFHFLRMPRERWVWDLAGGIIFFYIIVYLMDALILPNFFGINPLLFLSVLVIAGPIGFFLPFVFMIFTRSVFWRHEEAFESTLELFDIHPQIAKVQVERGYKLDHDEHHAVLWGVLEWEKGKRSSRRAGAAVLALLFTWLIPMLFVFQNPEIMWYQPLFVNIQLPLLAGLVAVVVYFVIRHWDKGAMASVLYATEGAREPIWMD